MCFPPFCPYDTLTTMADQEDAMDLKVREIDFMDQVQSHRPLTCDSPDPDPDAPVPTWRQQERYCQAAIRSTEELFLACSEFGEDILLWYLRNHRDEAFSARNMRGRTIIHDLALLRNTRMLSLAVAELKDTAWLDREEWNERGMTPLMLAAEKGNFAPVKFLAAQGVRIFKKSHEGKCAAEYAVAYPEIARFLKSLAFNAHSWIAQPFDWILADLNGDRKDAAETKDPAQLKLADSSLISSNPQHKDTSDQNFQKDGATLKKQESVRAHSEHSFLREERQFRTNHVLRVCRNAFNHKSDQVPLPSESISSAYDDGSGREQYICESLRHGMLPSLHIVLQLAGPSLRIRELAVSPKIMVPLVPALEANRLLRHIYIEGFHISDNNCHSLFASLEYSEIETLVLRSARLCYESACAIAKYLRSDHSRHLVSLDLEGNQLTDKGVQRIAQSMTSGNAKSLEVLNLASNGLGSARMCAMESIAAALSHNDRSTRLREINLSWNCFNPSHCALLFKVLTSNASDISLESLALAWNRVGQTGANSLCDLLKRNDKLRRLDFSNCSISPWKTYSEESQALCQRLASSFSQNKSLQFILLEGNCFPPEGIALMYRALNNHVPPIKFKLGIDSASGNQEFDVKHPVGHHRLDLAICTHRDRAVILEDMGRAHDGQNWRNESIDGERFTFSQSWNMPSKGLLELDFFDLDPIDTELKESMDRIDFGALCRILARNPYAPSSKTLIKQVCACFLFRALQILDILFYFSGTDRLEMLVVLLPCVSDRENIYLVLSALTAQQRHLIFERIPNLVLFDPVRPCHTYQIDLAKKVDHRLLRILIALVRQKVKGPERTLDLTLTHFNRGIVSGPWRNSMYDKQSFEDWIFNKFDNQKTNALTWEEEINMLAQWPHSGDITIKISDYVSSTNSLLTDTTSDSSPASDNEVEKLQVCLPFPELDNAPLQGSGKLDTDRDVRMPETTQVLPFKDSKDTDPSQPADRLTKSHLSIEVMASISHFKHQLMLKRAKRQCNNEIMIPEQPESDSLHTPDVAQSKIQLRVDPKIGHSNSLGKMKTWDAVSCKWKCPYCFCNFIEQHNLTSHIRSIHFAEEVEGKKGEADKLEVGRLNSKVIQLVARADDAPILFNQLIAHNIRLMRSYRTKHMFANDGKLKHSVRREIWSSQKPQHNQSNGDRCNEISHAKKKDLDEPPSDILALTSRAKEQQVRQLEVECELKAFGWDNSSGSFAHALQETYGAYR